MDVHELTAGYALDALDRDERERYEEHLAGCDRCRDELVGFSDVAAALALAADGPPPPPALRERILEEARAERQNVIPFRRRPVVPVLSAVAAVAAVALVAVGVASTPLGDALRGGGEHAVVDDPNARTVTTAGGEAELVVTPDGEAALVVRTLPPAPSGKDYEIWVFDDGVPHRAGLFERRGVAMLTRRIEPGQLVAVTLERDGGVDAPTGEPLFTASAGS